MQLAVFNKDQINSITDRSLPKAGRTFSRVKRDEILLSMTAEIAALLHPLDSPDSAINLNSINGLLQEALPEAGLIFGKERRLNVQEEIVKLVEVEFNTHNQKAEIYAREKRLEQQPSRCPPKIVIGEERKASPKCFPTVPVVLAATVVIAVAAFFLYS